MFQAVLSVNGTEELWGVATRVSVTLSPSLADYGPQGLGPGGTVLTPLESTF